MTCVRLNTGDQRESARPVILAPEILTGSIDLNHYNTALKQADVYSTSLVLWEICSRCGDFFGENSSVCFFILFRRGGIGRTDPARIFPDLKHWYAFLYFNFSL